MPFFVAIPVLVALGAGALWLRARRLRERAQAAELRAALEACVWENRIRGDETLEETVRELRQRGHDVNNVLSTALLSTQLFFDVSRADPASPNAAAELDAAAVGMVDALQRLKALIEDGRRAETTTQPRSALIEPVDLLDVLSACASRARSRRPRTIVVVHAPAHEVVLERVAVAGGRVGLERALSAVLENARDGNGAGRATRVEVRVGVRAEVDAVAVEVSDNGPGFTKTQLAQPIAVFASSKRGALGLSLYTAERIARASGGSLRRANADGGGAVVSLFLPLASEPAQPQ